MVEDKKNKRANALNDVNYLYKGFDFTARIFKKSLAKRCGEK
tara:strand:+ start:468 stop:593 length:126 start_codon:yes stop_codon:yes gene_type:complete